MGSYIALAILSAVAIGANAGVPEPYSMIVAQSTAEHPRNGEADMIRLKNGDLFLAYGRWDHSTDDFGAAEIRCMTSSDSGRTWTNDRVLVPNEGKLNTFSVPLLRLKNGSILMSYLVKDSTEDCNIFFRTSVDECKTWSPRRKFEMPPGYSGYTAMNNARLIQLKNNRVLAAAWEGYVRGRIIISFTLYSDDNGRTWRKSTDVDIHAIDPANKVGAEEPAVIELKDGRVMMLIRNNLGYIARSYSSDHGETWSRPELIKKLVAPVAPASLMRIPATGDLLLIWNHSPKDRHPLNSAISRDEGKTWEHIRTIDDGLGFAYTSITPVDDNIVLTYWSHEPTGLSLKLKSMDYRWFYEEDKQPGKDNEMLTVNPQPTFDLSPYLYMQFMEPLGTTDGSVAAAWDDLHDTWRPDLVKAAQEILADHDAVGRVLQLVLPLEGRRRTEGSAQAYAKPALGRD